MSKQKWVYLFKEVGQAEEYTGSWNGVRSLLGGKGANLGEMTRIGVPVPPGFTVSTEACNAYLEAGEQFPDAGEFLAYRGSTMVNDSAAGKHGGDRSVRNQTR